MYTTILHPRVHNLAFAASNKAQKIVLKQAAAFKRNANTKFRKQIMLYASREKG
jgi:hypothetical protein